MSQAAAPPHFRLFGIPVRVELLFFMIPLISITYTSVEKALVWTALVFVGVLVHELGHALVMRSFGFAPSITLHSLGGWTHYPPGAQPTPRQTFLITLAGPSAGLALGVIATALNFGLHDKPALLQTAIDDAMWINIGWSIINLLPILPWDGGIILDSGLAWLTGARRHFVVGTFSLLGGALVVVGAVLTRSFLLGYFGAMGVWHGWNRFNLKLSTPVADQGQGQGTRQQEQSWWERLHAGEDVEQDLRFQMMTAADPAKRAQYAELLAWACLRKRDFAGARNAVKQMGRFQPSLSLRARLAAAENDTDTVLALLSGAGAVADNDLPLLVSALIQRDRFDEVVQLGLRHAVIADVAATRLFEAGAFKQSLELCTAERMRTGIGRFAYNEACCLCRLGRPDDAVTALQKAKTLGCPELLKIDSDDDLAAVRDRPEVRALLTA
jgi:Zn-dependent protease